MNQTFGVVDGYGGFDGYGRVNGHEVLSGHEYFSFWNIYLYFIFLFLMWKF